MQPSSPIFSSGKTSFIKLSILVAGLVFSFWVINHWEYLPEWVPIPGENIMGVVACIQPLILIFWGIPLLILFVRRLVGNLKLLPTTITNRDIADAFGLISMTCLLLTSILPFLFSEQIEDVLIHYAVQRYDKTIDAIEQYRIDNGQYPLALEELVPEYLASKPRIYMKYGTALRYDSNSEWGYVGYGPFTFELFGSYRGIHGQTLKYCPIEDETCTRFTRINDRWVWAYSSAL